VRLLTARQLGLSPPQVLLGPGDRHRLARAGTDEVGLELGDHPRHVEQQAPHRVGGVIHRPAEVEPHLPCGQLIGGVAGVGQGAGEAVEPGHHQGVACPACGEGLTQPRALAVRTGEAVVDVGAPGAHPEAAQRLALGVEVLAVGGAAGIADPQRAYGGECPRCDPVTGRATGRPLRDTRGPCGTWGASAMEGVPVDDGLPGCRAHLAGGMGSTSQCSPERI